jgi:cell division protease FtsH
MELRRFFRAPLLLIAVAVLLLLFVLDYANSGSSYQQVDTSEIVSLINQGQVKSALITDKNQTIQITTKAGKELEASWVSGQGLQLANALQAQVVKGTLPEDGYNVTIPKSNALLDLLPTAFIYLVIFLLFFFMLSQMQGGGSRVMNFGKSKAKLITKDTPKTTFADVAGVDEAIEELQEIKEFLQTPAKFPVPARRCWPGPWPARPACRSTRSPGPTSSRCSSVSVPPASVTCSSRPRRTPPRSCSWTRSTPWAGTAARASAAGTTSASRR